MGLIVKNLNCEGPIRSTELQLGTSNHFSSCFNTEENQESLCLDGRSPDLPGAYRLLASSPADGDAETVPQTSWVSGAPERTEYSYVVGSL